MILVLILITGVVSFMAFSNRDLFDKLKFNAWYVKHDREWYRLLSYALLHADWAHLLINMFVLWSFSGVVMQFFERDFGQLASMYFLLLYIGGVVFSTLFDFAKQRDKHLLQCRWRFRGSFCRGVFEHHALP
jgi:membrane associated rhomboid family serine protease